MTQFIIDDQAIVDAFEQLIAMQRVGQPEDIADVIYFLAGEDARFVTGTITPVDGGLSASNGQPKIG